ncbi:MAG: sulfite oxidase [Raoultibacter sp.]
MIGTVTGTRNQPVTLSGYAQAFDTPVTALQFSADKGQTWSSFAVDDADPDCNVNWSFTFSPQEIGTYHITIRAQTADGRITPLPSCATVVVDR